MTISVSEERMGPHFVKYHLHNLPAYAVLHRFTRPDLGDPHDHPFSADIVIISGGYVEEVYELDGTMTVHHRKPGDTLHNPAGKIHRIVDLPEGDCLTLFVPGPHEQTSGFYQFREDGAYQRRWNEEDWKPVECQR